MTGAAILVAECTYNGLGYRFGWHYDADVDGDVDGSDPWYRFVYDERWRIVATYRGSDSDPKEQFVHHAAGDSGYGTASYIDDVILRDRDDNSGWTSAADGTLEERIYHCQNWRHDVVALIDATGAQVEMVRYSPYGVPFGLPAGDLDSDGDVDAADLTVFDALVAYDVRADLDLDGDYDATDRNTINANRGMSAGLGVLSQSGVASRKGYAGYAFAAELQDARSAYHVRHRVLDADLGRWMRRDPAGIPTNLYGYSVRPLGGTDAIGHAWIPVLQNSEQANGVGSAAEDVATMICRGVNSDSSGGSYGALIQHCYVRCCKPSGSCTDYSLLTGYVGAPGMACIVRNREPGSHGHTGNPGSVHKTKRGPGLCDCLESAFLANGGGDCPFEYQATNCNSNWFAGSMWECCTGSRGIGPFGAHFYQDRDCCRDGVTFSCPPDHPGAGRRYTCLFEWH